MLKADILIIGGGLAAIMTALKASERYKVTLVIKGSRKSGNSWRAQGGIAAALSSVDHPELHYQDTMKAGCDQNDPELVKILVHEGPKRLKHWMEKGLTFDKKEDGTLALGREGAHSQRRIVHNDGDQTGKICMEYYWKLLEKRDVTILEDHQAIDLVIVAHECVGATFHGPSGQVVTIRASATVLATGGIGGLFEATTNDPTLVGDGLAMALRAGATLRDLEFIQFHPTLIYSQSKVIGLASEALRGEGAFLVSEAGQLIMESVHPLGDLAPRDVVARVIQGYVHRGEQVFLDTSMIHKFEKRFPQIAALCKKGKVDLSQKRIPIRPGAHFHMGGVETDAFGKTSIPHLYAVGEVAGNNLHGANRLASNSLLEAIVFGERLGEYLANLAPRPTLPTLFSVNNKEQKVTPKLPNVNEVKKRVSHALNITRNEADLKELLHWLSQYEPLSERKYNRTLWSKKRITSDNMRIVASLLATAALDRKVSCGAHERSDTGKLHVVRDVQTVIS
ncbi:L-aspartate oxidase [Alkalihalophilus lindianensis]|uniref:L-aspartate oxidase n=1 Tax=Alkalihalophilus lindianensis TaxID=1630542 RepID=A0ABU3XEG1_9BACI|nr:L-aspartate oxidase [Alkalihalophilus lindianensis]MDV2685814.1 L-aspartate oxidase [Alkalihalophilus lindianensis]